METVIRVLKRERDLQWPFTTEPAIEKKPKKLTSEEILRVLIENYPQHTFRLGPKDGNPKRKRVSGWVSVCIHNIQKAGCKEPECEGGQALCKIHGRQKSKCGGAECGGGGSRCKLHNRIRSECPEPECGGGGGLCKLHRNRKAYCREPECGGGQGYCGLHGTRRDICSEPECKGGGSLCEKHGEYRYKCPDPECGGGGGLCAKHGELRHYCTDPECGGGGSICIACKIQRKKIGDYCITCHPDYVPGMPSASKVGCEYICSLQKHLRVEIQHIHYDQVLKAPVGKEYILPEYKRKRVDGYYKDTHGNRIVIEFLGDYYHGHPSLWGPNEQNRGPGGILHKDKFYKTQKMLTKVASYGYTVFYVWEKEYRQLRGLDSVESILREFDGTLKY